MSNYIVILSRTWHIVTFALRVIMVACIEHTRDLFENDFAKSADSLSFSYQHPFTLFAALRHLSSITSVHISVPSTTASFHSII